MPCPLKMTSEIKSNYSFFVMLSTQDSEYWIGFSKLFWEYGKLDSIFQVAKMVNFCVFSVLFEYLMTLCQETKKTRRSKKILTKVSDIRSVSKQQKVCFSIETCRRSSNTNTSCHRKNR